MIPITVLLYCMMMYSNLKLYSTCKNLSFLVCPKLLIIGRLVTVTYASYSLIFSPLHDKYENSILYSHSSQYRKYRRFQLSKCMPPSKCVPYYALLPARTCWVIFQVGSYSVSNALIKSRNEANNVCIANHHIFEAEQSRFW